MITIHTFRSALEFVQFELMIALVSAAVALMYGIVVAILADGERRRCERDAAFVGCHRLNEDELTTRLPELPQGVRDGMA